MSYMLYAVIFLFEMLYYGNIPHEQQQRKPLQLYVVIL